MPQIAAQQYQPWSVRYDSLVNGRVDSGIAETPIPERRKTRAPGNFVKEVDFNNLDD